MEYTPELQKRYLNDVTFNKIVNQITRGLIDINYAGTDVTQVCEMVQIAFTEAKTPRLTIVPNP